MTEPGSSHSFSRAAGAVVLALLLAGGAAFAQNPNQFVDNSRPTAGEWAVKMGCGLAGELAAFGVIGATSHLIWPHGDQSDWRWDWVFDFLTIPVLVPPGTALGVKLAGDRYGEFGSGWAACGGGCVGALGTMTLGYIGLWQTSSGRLAFGIPLLVVAALLPPAAAAAGYNLVPTDDFALEKQRVLPPSVSLGMTSRVGGRLAPGLSVRLVTIRL